MVSLVLSLLLKVTTIIGFHDTGDGFHNGFIDYITVYLDILQSVYLTRINVLSHFIRIYVVFWN